MRDELIRDADAWQQGLADAMAKTDWPSTFSGLRAPAADTCEKSEDSLTIEALVRHLRIEPATANTFLEQLATQIAKEYLAVLTKPYVTIEELARRLSLETKTIKNKMDSGVFKNGVHYFSPPGIRPRFKWSAIVEWLEEKQPANSGAAPDAIPMARGYVLGNHCENEKPGSEPGFESKPSPSTKAAKGVYRAETQIPRATTAGQVKTCR
jgi:hypothetical protein